MKLSHDPESVIRTPENCSYRETDSAGQHNSCRILTELTGIVDADLCRVTKDACVACCAELREPEQVNPVIASLLYGVTTRIRELGGHPECSVGRADLLRRCATDQLALELSDIGHQFPPRAAVTIADPIEPGSGTCRSVRWATAMLTAPRTVPQIEGSIENLFAAGFDGLHVFAEPGSLLPNPRPGLHITVHNSKLGNIRNFCTALVQMRALTPNADVFVVFQDDIRAAAGLRAWFERQLWPLDNGVVSLFTPGLHADTQSGWRILRPGFQRVCGAQALAFRRDILDRFLSDPQVLSCLITAQHGDDAVLGGWLNREGRGIAYHTPSLIEHVGDVSSVYLGRPDRRNFALAVDDVAKLSQWQPPLSKFGEVGLVGWNTPTGLGTMNRDLAAQLPVRKWLVPRHPDLNRMGGRVGHGTTVTHDFHGAEDIHDWLESLDWLLFVERPLVEDLPRMAAHRGVGIACIPMWEWVQPHHRWLQFVDVMLCPTQLTFDLMEDWKVRYGFGWRTVYFRWPIAPHAFRFQQRSVCRKFLFVNGWGGGTAHRPDGPQCGYHRKGLELILAAAAIAPDLNFTVVSQMPLPWPLPENIEVRAEPTDSSTLYNAGDVCVQPSHYEGLGLQLLECQAAGMPLITTNARPMNEHLPWKTIPVRDHEVLKVGDGYISSELMNADDLVATLRPLVGCDISEASLQARHNIETQHNWDTARQLLHCELRKR